MKWLAKLSRVTSSGSYIPEVDGIRFVAISMVILGHILVYTTEKTMAHLSDNSHFTLIIGSFTNAGLGVNLFFVLSGFILALPFAAHYIHNTPPIDLKKYYLRRLTRLEPPYIIALIIAFILLVYVQSSVSCREAVPHLAASLGYSHYVFWPNETPRILPVAWSLEAEIQFYLIAPFIAYLFLLKKQPRRILLISLIIAIPFTVKTLQLQYPIKLINHIQFFLAGYILADLYLTQKKDNRFGMIGILSILLLLIVVPHFLDLTFTNEWLTPLLIIPCFYFILNRKLFISFFSNKFITTIGGMCYTLYLFHYMIISGVGRKTIFLHVSNDIALNFFVQCLLIIPFILLFCIPFFYYIERVCMKKDWYRKLFSKERSELLK